MAVSIRMLLADIPWYFALGLFFLIGLPAGFVFYRLYRLGIRKSAEKEAQEIIGEARDQLEILELEQKEQLQDIEEELWSKVEKEFGSIEEKIEDLEETATENKARLDQKVNVLKSRNGQAEKDVEALAQKLKGLENGLEQRREKKKSLVQDYIGALEQRLQIKRAQVLQEIQTQLESETERRAQASIDEREADAKDSAEIYAKEIINRALLRFHRAYSAERGIAPVYFENPEQRKVLLDPAGLNLKTVTECTGCDIYVEEGSDLIGVAGFDPVRRELTRRVLERCLKEKRPINPEFVKKAYENIKRELISLIRRDGDAIAKELKLEGLHPEIRQMMGSLRYRYSFTQNQYFHCGEVGWLCGLLAQELGGVDVKKARRAGMLHDLGKSMDHEMDGGHAVIGANFIQARGEAADVIHAVRAHHYDETPSTDMAFLVIGADAISGARPGARRSTIESYNQKVSELDAISRSFDGVTDCIILNGGRECRVMVNSRQVDDLKALQLSRKIADRIQEECNYPGHIKVVVVRETTSIEATTR